MKKYILILSVLILAGCSGSEPGAEKASAEKKRVIVPEKKYFVNVDLLSLRRMPSRKSDRIKKLKRSDLLVLIDIHSTAEEGEWYLVQTLSGMEGWVSGLLVKEKTK